MVGRKRRRYAGLAILCLAAACGTAPVPEVPTAPGFQSQATAFANADARERWQTCQRLGSKGVTRRLAGRIVRQAVRDYGLQRFVTQADVNEARRQMADLLVWRLGDAGRICELYVRKGIGSFERRFADDAAGLLLGVVGIQDNRPYYRVPSDLIG
jgi:hypothetical protein